MDRAIQAHGWTMSDIQIFLFLWRKKRDWFQLVEKSPNQIKQQLSLGQFSQHPANPSESHGLWMCMLILIILCPSGGSKTSNSPALLLICMGFFWTFLRLMKINDLDISEIFESFMQISLIYHRNLPRQDLFTVLAILVCLLKQAPVFIDLLQ